MGYVLRYGVYSMESNKQEVGLNTTDNDKNFFRAARFYLPLLVLIIIVSIVFIAIYRLDNKFTQDAAQPVNGVLELTGDELKNYPSRYIINDWKLYSGVMLTPADFADGEPDYDYTVVSIGKDVSFTDGGNCTPFTCGTYVMRLKLPEEFYTYSIEIYQAFSAFRMYIDGNAVLQVGNPDTENYIAATSNRMATFDHAGSEEVLVIINVNNESFYCGGLIYPPMFGFPTVQNVKRVTIFGLSLTFAAITLVSAVLCVFFAIKQRKKIFLLVAVMFVVLTAYTSYMVIHTLLVLPPQPLQAIELLCGYIVLSGMVIMHGTVCRLPKTMRFITAAIAVAMLPPIAVYGLNMQSLATSPLKYTSAFLTAYKLAVGAYILITAVLSVQKVEKVNKLIFCAGIAYGCACIWDRLLPLYQPIYVGSFPEWSCAFAVAAINITFIHNLFEGYANRLVYMEEQRQMARQLEMQRDYSAAIRSHSDENRRLIHDFRQHIRVIDGMADKLGGTEIFDYLKKVNLELNSNQKIDNIDFCENSAVDALLRYYSGALANRGIEFRCSAIIPKAMPTPDTELCSVIGNLLENAMEACERESGRHNRITFTSSVNDNRLNIAVKNNSLSEVRRANNGYISLKRGRNGSGIGLMSVKRIVESRGGNVKITTENGVFMVMLWLPF